MQPQSVVVSVAFRREWQRPFRDGDSLRVYRDGDRALLAELPAAFVLALVQHYLMGQALQARVADHLTPLPTPAVKPLAKARSPRLLATQGRRLRR
jgi:hypothetical protein